ncbi:hypothetical protein HYPSUDRAFT_72089 [Hypholoma sublateritium FD-334 SS-4]|uniref:Uncharacterized protein n=1 Tax=Hypholoma sublateritium (strain FD-334 SS-4) TaxID=945553 RepID=A0A0D2NFF6_HYPSF|nr:hypothetical protein HYPSUDRAFT_72089 [Hypholoma sublateritium FD-334 SS-4]
MRLPEINLLARLGVPPTGSPTVPPNTITITSTNPAHTPNPTTTPKFDPLHAYVSSPLLRRPAHLAAARAGIALYALATLAGTLGWNVAHGTGDSYFSYFTYLTYTGLAAYYVAAAVQTFFYAFSPSYLSSATAMNAKAKGYPLQRWPRILQALHVVLQATVVSFPFVVTVVFWALLADGSTFATPYSAWSNLSVHAFNTLFALLELLGTHAPPPPWAALPLTLALLAAYLGVAYITRAAQGFYRAFYFLLSLFPLPFPLLPPRPPPRIAAHRYPHAQADPPCRAAYPFLDPATQHGKLAAYILGIAAAQALAFAAARGAAVLRVRWAARRGRGPLNDRAIGADGGGGGRGIGGGRGMGGMGGGMGMGGEVCVELDGGWAAARAGGAEGKAQEGEGKASVESV